MSRIISNPIEVEADMHIIPRRYVLVLLSGLALIPVARRAGARSRYLLDGENTGTGSIRILLKRVAQRYARQPLNESRNGVIPGDRTSNNLITTDMSILDSANPELPPSGYHNLLDFTSIYSSVRSKGGFNVSSSSNEGRSGIAAVRVNIQQDGQGDLFAYNASARIRSRRDAASHWLASPAAVLFGGTIIGESDGAYLNPIEIHLTDKPEQVSYACAAVGMVLNFDRNSGTSSIGQVWSGIRVQSQGPAAVDNIISATGKFDGGIDLSMMSLDFGLSKAAIALKADDRIYLNTSSRERKGQGSLTRKDWKATSGYDDYVSYNSNNRSIEFTVDARSSTRIDSRGITTDGVWIAGDLVLKAGQVHGWERMTGQEDMSTPFDTTTITLLDLAKRVKAIESVLHAEGPGQGFIGN